VERHRSDKDNGVEAVYVLIFSFTRNGLPPNVNATSIGSNYSISWQPIQLPVSLLNEQTFRAPFWVGETSISQNLVVDLNGAAIMDFAFSTL
jgi:spore germination protein YaaH